ncbi:PREDICTED: gibberellin 2-beta-dioxygenase 2-like [Ipomoea nil]|uniref:gibberellin 2-beta-dioxygenase 2-like n=1 Tax=Ipomoea nil TaxID=35883 RepID=UPI000901E2D1|nr:PREDICTED: gibberellin 2-beta-dioxygenase 2-like [Ipomoea nil]
MGIAKTSSIDRMSEKIPVIDLCGERSEVSSLIVNACEEFGFFKVINHGVGEDVVRRMEDQSFHFFRKPAFEKHKLAAPPANPYGYGCKNIGFNGDVGEVEYLILHANLLSLAQKSNLPLNLSSAVKGYVEALGELACKILELMAEGLHIQETSVFSNLIKDVQSDSIFRLNYYPPISSTTSLTPTFNDIVGFGEHTDPQILTILKSNDVAGLQISFKDGVWIPISPEPRSGFFVNVGDMLQVLTNGRFMSVRHRVMVGSLKTRMSMMYFAAPTFNTTISCPSKLVTPENPRLYRAFTWAEYKKTTYSRKLGDNRLHFFRVESNDLAVIILTNLIVGLHINGYMLNTPSQVQQQVLDVITHTASKASNLPKACVQSYLKGHFNLFLFHSHSIICFYQICCAFCLPISKLCMHACGVTCIAERVADIETRAQVMKCLTCFCEAVSLGFVFEKTKERKIRVSPKLSPPRQSSLSATPVFPLRHASLPSPPRQSSLSATPVFPLRHASLR